MRKNKIIALMLIIMLSSVFFGGCAGSENGLDRELIDDFIDFFIDDSPSFIFPESTNEGPMFEELISFSLKDATNIEISGYNGFGSLNVSFDKNIIENNITNSALLYSFNYNFETSENLKNGDIIEIEVSYNDEEAKKLGFLMVDTTFIVNIEGLGELSAIKLNNIVNLRLGNLASTFYGIIIEPTDSFPENLKLHSLSFICDEFPDNTVSNLDNRGNDVIMIRFTNNTMPDEGKTITLRLTDENALGRAGYSLESEYGQFILE